MCTNDGFYIFDTSDQEPYISKFYVPVSRGVKFAELLYDTNLIAYISNQNI